MTTLLGSRHGEDLMRRWLVAALLALAPPLVTAAPLRITHQARLLDASGAPLSGAHTVHARLFDGAGTGATELWARSFAVDVVDGYASVVLGADGSLTSALFDRPELWLEVEVGSAGPLDRVRLVSVPYAVEAAEAERARGLRILTQAPDPAVACAEGEVVFDTTISAVRACVGGAWDPPTLDCEVPWKPTYATGTLSDGIAADTVFSVSPAAKVYASVVLSYDFTGDFEVISSWAQNHQGIGIVHGPSVHWANVSGYSTDSNGPYFGAIGTTGFPSGYSGTYRGHYSFNGATTAQYWHRWLRSGTSVSVQVSTTGSSGPWSHISGSPFTVPAADTVVIGIGEAGSSEAAPLTLLSCVQP